MADIAITTYTNKTYKSGASTVVPGFVEGSPGSPINPPGSGGASEFVPYVGANQNVNLGELGILTGFITLDTTPTNTPTTQGTFYWDEDDNTVDIILNGYIMKVGEDLFYPVKNQTGSSIAKGTNVRFAGTVGGSGRLLITPYLADGSLATSRYMGVTAETIANGEDGKVLWFGRIRGINTNAYNEGDILYASTTSAGGFQTTLPVAPNNIVEVCAVVTKSVNNGVIFVRPQFLSSGSKWTDVGANIYRDSAVAIGRTTIPANATFAVQNKSSANNIINLINNANTTSVLTVNDSGHTAIVGTGFGFNYFNVLDGATSLFSVLGQGGSSSVQIGASNFSAKSATFTSASAGAGITFFDIRNNSGTSFLSLRTDNLLFINIATVYSNGANFSFGTTTGTKIGTTTSQKLGFWNATPIVQPTTAIAESAFVENAGGTAVNDDSTFDGYTLRQVVKALRDAGLLA